MNKKGADNTVWILVAVIIAVVVLIFGLVIVFDINGLRTKWFGGLGGADNVDVVTQNCNTACAPSFRYDFCCKVRNIVYTTDQKVPDRTTCFKLGVTCSTIGTCGVEDCPNVVCDTLNYVGVVVDVNAVAGTSCLKANTVAGKTLDKDLTPLTKDQVCCKPAA